MYSLFRKKSIDAGLCWIGDPCYILHPKKTPNAVGKDWREFCQALRAGSQYPTAKQFNFDNGHAGLGLVVETGYGDGVYPVYAEISNGRVARVLIEFIGDAAPEEAHDR